MVLAPSDLLVLLKVGAAAASYRREVLKRGWYSRLFPSKFQGGNRGSKCSVSIDEVGQTEYIPDITWNELDCFPCLWLNNTRFHLREFVFGIVSDLQGRQQKRTNFRTSSFWNTVLIQYFYIIPEQNLHDDHSSRQTTSLLVRVWSSAGTRFLIEAHFELIFSCQREGEDFYKTKTSGPLWLGKAYWGLTRNTTSFNRGGEGEIGKLIVSRIWLLLYSKTMLRNVARTRGLEPFVFFCSY